MIYCFDIDGTICTLMHDSRYDRAKPFPDMVKCIGRLYDEGHTIKLFTARGSVSARDWTVQTIAQLELWGVKYHELIMNRKPHYDLMIDDKAINVEDWARAHNLRLETNREDR